MRMLIAGAAVLALSAGMALAQETQTTTTEHATGSTQVGNPSTNRTAKGGESYQWSVDTTTTKVPVHPTETEKTTTTTTAAPNPPPVVHRKETTTTTTSTGQD